MSRAQARALAREAHPEVLELPVWEPLQLEGGESVERFAGEFGAFVRDRQGRRSAVDSTLPLRSAVGDGDKRLADLTLTDRGGTLEPVNPLVATAIAKQLSGGVELAGGELGVRLESPSPAEAEVVEDKAFFANALADTDMLVTPTPRGVGVALQVRSVDAPERAVLSLDLPQGAQLRLVADEGPEARADRVPGSAEIVRAGKVLSVIRPPVGWDADQVPLQGVRYEVSGDDLVVHYPHRSQDILYPAIIDPQIDRYRVDSLGRPAPGTYVIGRSDDSEYPAWSFNNAGGGSESFGAWPPQYPETSESNSPLYLASGGARWYAHTAFGQWYWWAPRESWIYRADFVNVHFTPAYDYPAATCLLEGIYSTATGDWEPGNMYSPVGTGPEYRYMGRSPWVGGPGPDGSCSPQSYNSRSHFSDNPSRHNIVAFRLFAAGDGYRANTSSAQMDGAALHLEDAQPPTVNSANTAPGGWVRSADITTNVAARDAPAGTAPERGGLGMFVSALFVPKENGGEGQLTLYADCTNGHLTRCPEYQAFNHSYNTDTTDLDPNTQGVQRMAEGIHTIRGEAYDAIGKKTPFDAGTVKIDRTPPEVEVEGTLKPEDRSWVGTGEQSLSIDAGDATSGAVSAEFRIGEMVVGETFTQECPEPACSLEYDLTVDPDDVQPQAPGAQALPEGNQEATVTVRDAAGNPRVVSWTFRHDRTPPQLTVPPGPLKNADGQTLDPEQTYSMVAEATDGVAPSEQSGMGRIEVSVDEDVDEDSYEQDCPRQPGDLCNATRTFDYVAGDYDEGPHEVRVSAVDLAGNSATETIGVNNPLPPEPACQTPTAAIPLPNAEFVDSTIAQTSLQSVQGLPEALLPSTPFTLAGEIIKPGFSGGGLLPFVASETVDDVRVDWSQATGATLAVDTEGGPVCLSPTQVSILPSDPSLPISGALGFFANSMPATDIAIRPSAAGADIFAQVRGLTASRELSWKVDLQPELVLRPLEDGSIGVVRPGDPEAEPSMLSEPIPAAPPVAEQRAAITDTNLGLLQAADMHDRLAAPIADELVAVIRKPWAKDRNGQPVATSLSASGSTITMSLPPLPELLAYPVVANTQLSSVSAADDADTAREFTDPEAVPHTDEEEAAFEASPPPGSGGATPEPAPEDDTGADEDLVGDYPDSGSLSAPFTVPDGDERAPEGADPPDASTAVSSASLAPGISRLNVGLSDGNAAILKNSQFRGLAAGNHSRGVTFLRVFVPWNYEGIRNTVRDRMSRGLLTRECNRQAVARWDGTGPTEDRGLVTGVARPGYRDLVEPMDGVEVMVVFSPRAQGEGCKQPDGGPPPKRYRMEIRRFLRTNRFVDRVTAWNEPNFAAGRPNAGVQKNPTRAAQYWKNAAALCRRQDLCREGPAGAFAGFAGPGNIYRDVRTVRDKIKRRAVNYTKAYKIEIGRRIDGNRNRFPRFWAFHSWLDSRVYSASRSPERTKTRQIAKFRDRFSQDGTIAPRVYSGKDDYRYGPKGTTKPGIWITEIGALYRLDCGKVTFKKSESKPKGCREEALSPAERAQFEIPANEKPTGTVVFGEARQTKAAAFIVRSAITTRQTEATEVTRLYYYNFVDTAGYKYPGAGRSGRCFLRTVRNTTRPKCNTDDSGLVGSQADDFDVKTDEGHGENFLNGRTDPPLSRSGEARDAYCLLRDRKASEFRIGKLRQKRVSGGRLVERPCNL